MCDFFAIIYELFVGVYGEGLGYHLYGYDSNSSNGYPCLYQTIGIFTLLTSILGVIIFYYVINHPKFSRWFHWLIILIITGIISSSFAYYLPYEDLIADKIFVDFNVSGTNIFLFSFSNFLISSLYFLLFSLALRWWSSNSASTPIPS